MEWKIREVKQINGEWYQCVIGNFCLQCDLHKSNLSASQCDYNSCCFACKRKDKTPVVFKKLEKVGEPFACRNMSLGRYGIIVQRYKVFAEPILTDGSIRWCDSTNKTILIALNNKEDMEENKLNLKPFDLEAAKSGKPVCTRDGRKARIICFDMNADNPIVALVDYNGQESVVYCHNDGRNCSTESTYNDLMMLSEKKEGWAVIRRSDIYENEEQAKKALLSSHTAVMLRKITWEE